MVFIQYETRIPRIRFPSNFVPQLDAVWFCLKSQDKPYTDYLRECLAAGIPKVCIRHIAGYGVDDAMIRFLCLIVVILSSFSLGNAMQWELQPHRSPQLRLPLQRPLLAQSELLYAFSCVLCDCSLHAVFRKHSWPVPRSCFIPAHHWCVYVCV